MATPQKVQVQEKSSGWLNPNWVQHVRNNCGTGASPPVYMMAEQEEQEEGGGE